MTKERISKIQMECLNRIYNEMDLREVAPNTIKSMTNRGFIHISTTLDENGFEFSTIDGLTKKGLEAIGKPSANAPKAPEKHHNTPAAPAPIGPGKKSGAVIYKRKFGVHRFYKPNSSIMAIVQKDITGKFHVKHRDRNGHWHHITRPYQEKHNAMAKAIEIVAGA